MSNRIHAVILASLLGIMLAAAPAALAQPQTTWYVDDDAPLSGDGQSWATPYTYLQDVLTDAAGGSIASEIRIGGGVYKPDADEGGNVTPGDRSETFQLLNDVAIRGGYRGLAGGGDPDDRDIVAFETILSGNINGQQDDWDNSYHVVTGSGTDVTAVLDGVTITSGYAYKYSTDPWGGGGVYIDTGSPVFQRCTIRDNQCGQFWGPQYDATSGKGGGLFCVSGSPQLIDCEIRDNRAADGRDFWCEAGVAVGEQNGGAGGGLYFVASMPVLVNCAIIANESGDGSGGGSCDSVGGNNGRAGGSGGGFGLVSGSSALFLSCTVSQNATGAGGSAYLARGGNGGSGAGIFVTGSSVASLVNCVISDNHTADGGNAREQIDWGEGGDGGSGGGVCVMSDSYAHLVNCVIEGNTAGDGGTGAIFADPDSIGGDGGAGGGIFGGLNAVDLVNCTLLNNRTGEGGTGYIPGSEGQGGGLSSSSPELANCILWGNQSSGTIEEQQLVGDDITIDYSCVEGWTGGLGGSGNIGSDPSFYDPDSGDYHLTLGSPCIDAADNTAVPADEADVDNDGDTAERVPLDLDGLARFVDDPNTVDTGVPDPPDYPYVVDMGAYEYQAEPCFGDLDGDDDVDLSDLATLLANYGMTSGAVYEDGDLDGDGDVDLSDVAALLAVYGTSCP